MTPSLTGCAGAGGTEGTAGNPASIAVQTDPATYHYVTVVHQGQRIEAESEQTFSYLSDERWVSIYEQDGEHVSCSCG